MFIVDIEIKNFRNLNFAGKVSKDINFIIGKNGSGKTNLLESIHFLSVGSSFRTSREKHCINFDIYPQVSRISANIQDYLGNETKIDVVIEGIDEFYIKKYLKINSKNIPKKKFINNIYSIIFSPDTIDLVKGEPSIRRNDIDEFLTIIDYQYKDVIFNYKKVVRSRNLILEKGSS